MLQATVLVGLSRFAVGILLILAGLAALVLPLFTSLAVEALVEGAFVVAGP